MPEYTPAPSSDGDTSPLTTKGDLYGFNTDDARIPVGTNGQVLTADSAQALGLKWATSVAGANTLDQAYDQGGAGNGRVIDADSGPVEITVSDTDNNAALHIAQEDITNNPEAISVTNRGTNAGIYIDQNGAGTGIVIEQYHANAKGLKITDDGTNARQPTIELKRLSIPIEITHDASNNLLLGLSGAADVLHIPVGGLVLGGGPNTINGGITSGLGTTNDGGIALGDACTVGSKQLVIGQGTDSTPYAPGVGLIGIGGDSNVVGTFSNMSAVIDGGNQASGPVGGGAVPVAPTAAGVGNIYLDSGGFFSGSADYAEMFEWDDGNANNADRRGFFVSLTNGNKIVNGGSDVIGVISARPVIVGDAAELGWHGKFLLDEFGLPLYERMDGNYVPQTNPNYNPTAPYTSRRARKEWGIVGLIGKLYVRSAQVLSAGSRCTSNSNGYAVAGNDYRILKVVRQATNTKYGIIEILMK